MNDLVEWVDLTHELAQLRAGKELSDTGNDRTNVNELPRSNRLGVIDDLGNIVVSNASRITETVSPQRRAKYSASASTSAPADASAASTSGGSPSSSIAAEVIGPMDARTTASGSSTRACSSSALRLRAVEALVNVTASG